MEKRKKRADETEGRVGARDCPLAAGRPDEAVTEGDKKIQK